MKQKIVIKVRMNDQKSRRKALRTVAGYSGVESAAIKGQEKNQIEVTGDGIDAVKITTMLRKNVGYAEIVSVNPVDEEKDGEAKDDCSKPNECMISQPLPVFYDAPRCMYEVRHFDPYCLIL